MSGVARDVAAGAAKRRRDRRYRSFWRHELMAVRMATLTACHRSAQKKPAATHAATQTAVTYREQAPVLEYVAPAPDVFEVAPAPEVERVALTLAVTYTAPSSAASAPAVTCSTPAPKTDYVTHPPVMEYIAPAPPVVFDTPSQMLPFAHIMAALTAGVGIYTASVVFEAPHKKQCASNDFSQLVAQLDASSRAMEQSVADFKAKIDLMNKAEQTNLIQSADASSSIPVPTPAAHEVASFHDLALRGFRTCRGCALNCESSPSGLKSRESVPRMENPAMWEKQSVPGNSSTSRRPRSMLWRAVFQRSTPARGTVTIIELWTVYEMASACPGRYTNIAPSAACFAAHPSFGPVLTINVSALCVASHSSLSFVLRERCSSQVSLARRQRKRDDHITVERVTPHILWMCQRVFLKCSTSRRNSRTHCSLSTRWKALEMKALGHQRSLRWEGDGSVSQHDDQKQRTPSWMHLDHHVASEICFQPLHPVRPWLNRVTSEIAFQPSFQTPALVALPFFLSAWCHCGTCHVIFCVLDHCTDFVSLYPFWKKNKKTTYWERGEREKKQSTEREREKKQQQLAGRSLKKTYWKKKDRKNLLKKKERKTVLKKVEKTNLLKEKKTWWKRGRKNLLKRKERKTTEKEGEKLLKKNEKERRKTLLKKDG